MARPRGFDCDTALDQAMDTVWLHGYGNTSLPQLLEPAGGGVGHPSGGGATATLQRASGVQSPQ